MNKRHFEVGDIVKYVGYKETGSGMAGYITRVTIRYTYIKWFAHGIENIPKPVCREFIEKLT